MSGIAVTWKDLKHAQLIDERQREEDKRWDQEFTRRRTDLEKQRQLSSQRRYIYKQIPVHFKYHRIPLNSLVHHSVNSVS